MPKPPVAEISPPFQQRRRETLADFERRRDAAQFQAAKSRWQQGDIAACESSLLQLLQRVSEHLEARRLLANVYLENENLAEHERHLRRILQDHPRDAQSHHALALHLETSDRQQEAAQHFQQAAQLRPKNKLYAMSRPLRAAPKPVQAGLQPVLVRTGSNRLDSGSR